MEPETQPPASPLRHQVSRRTIVLICALPVLLAVASRIGVEPGPYTHVSGTFHIYKSQVELAKQLVASSITPVDIGVMHNSPEAMKQLLEYERNLRMATIRGDAEEVNNIASNVLSRNSFYERVMVLLLVHSLMILGQYDKAVRVSAGAGPVMGDLLRQYCDGNR